MAKVINYNELPIRVKNQLTALQYQSEFWVAGVQLVVILILTIINTFSPATYSPDAPVNSASLGLSLFTIIIVLRFWFVYTKQLRPWLLAVFVIAEMSLLLWIIWTYHLQYEISETINLKNPLVYFTFVLITLRALRFEPKWVILSGFVAALGWIGIVLHSLYVSGLNSITWDYFTFATTGSLYLGTVFDLILSIILVTAIIALVLFRARNVLFQAVSQTSAVQDLARFFDSEIVEKIIGADLQLQAGYGELRDAVILFIDLRGFTKLSKSLSPQALIEILKQYQSLLLPIIQKYHGTIDKFMGDGIMVSFGAVMSNATYAADALMAIDDIISAVATWNEKQKNTDSFTIQIGIGVAMGKVVFGVIGHQDRLEYTVIGETVNLAAKLEKHNKISHSQVLVTEKTVEEAITQGYIMSTAKEECKAAYVDGVSDPIDLVIFHR